jgi:hypothetical protein
MPAGLVGCQAGVPALPRGGQRGAASGVVAMRLLQVGGQLRLGGESADVEASRARLALLVRLLAHPCQGVGFAGLAGVASPVRMGGNVLSSTSSRSTLRTHWADG